MQAPATPTKFVEPLICAEVEHDDATPAALNRLANHVERWLTAATELNLMPRAAILVNHAEALASHLHRPETGGDSVPLLYGNLAGAFRARGEPSRAEELLHAELDVPYLDRKTLDGAKRLDLPSEPKRLARLVDAEDLPALAAALVRVSLDAKLARKISE